VERIPLRVEAASGRDWTDRSGSLTRVSEKEGDVAVVLEDLMRQYDDLGKRAVDLRRHL
jgi:hypothetical protein